LSERDGEGRRHVGCLLHCGIHVRAVLGSVVVGLRFVQVRTVSMPCRETKLLGMLRFCSPFRFLLALTFCCCSLVFSRIPLFTKVSEVAGLRCCARGETCETTAGESKEVPGLSRCVPSFPTSQVIGSLVGVAASVGLCGFGLYRLGLKREEAFERLKGEDDDASYQGASSDLDSPASSYYSDS
jgi:hypothetical protein